MGSLAAQTGKEAGHRPVSKQAVLLSVVGDARPGPVLDPFSKRRVWDSCTIWCRAQGMLVTLPRLNSWKHADAGGRQGPTILDNKTTAERVDCNARHNMLRQGYNM